jgi:glycine/D-amino acid oxidase-like deaminating enzyme
LVRVGKIRGAKRARSAYFLRFIITILDSDGVQQADLRGGRSPWLGITHHDAPRLCLESNIKCDALIVGAGITGSLLAERLTRQGLDVVIIDRELPGRGSTAASTSMLLWEIDRSLAELTEIYGFESASRAYHASLHAVAGLSSLVQQLGIPCEFRARPSLYLAAGSTGRELLSEHQLRERAGLPGEFLDHSKLADAFGITRAGAIVSPGAADANPMYLARGMLRTAVARGARVFEAEANEFDTSSGSVGVQLEGGHLIEAGSAILATGYVAPPIIHSTIQKISSSWAIATVPQPQNVWKNGALIWEDAKDYLYARSTSTGRIIIGGEDSDKIIEPADRDRLIPEKARTLAQRLAALWPAANLDIEFRWSGAFDTTDDGLPLIGPVPGKNHIYAAYGYGGNGITFSFLAAQLIGDLIAGTRSQLLSDFALDRDGQPS